MSHKFSTMTTEELYPELRDNYFKNYDKTLIQKEPFTVELDDKEIKLHLFIRNVDMSDYEDSQDHIIEIGIIPSFNSLTEKHQHDITNQYDHNEKDMLLNDNITLLSDVLDYGFTLTLHSETITTTDMDKVQELMDTALSVSPCVSGLIGFDLDRIYNRIGNTGWDILNEYCCGVDRLDAVLERYKGE